MHIIIRNSSPVPLYEQIVQQLRREILTGGLAAGESLPSIRALAQDLRISVITTKRAYEELERAGLIETVAGKGSFVAQVSHTQMREHALQRMEEHFEIAAQIAEDADITEDDAVDLLRMFFRGEGT